MVPFAGWEMPVQYEGVIPEHRAVRTDAGVFDVSHMGQFHVEGPNAHELLQSLLSNDLDKIGDGEAQYTLLTNERGGIVDDLIAYRIGAHHYLVVVNAGNRDAAYAWMKEREIRGSEIRDASDEYALLAVQGPRSLERLGLPRGEAVHARDGRARRRRGDGQPHRLHRRAGRRADVPGGGRGGALGRDRRPRRHACGLGARDTLRLEVCYPLHGNDITPDTDAISAGLGWTCALEKEFSGVDELRRIKEAGPEQKLVAFVMEEKAVPRNGMAIAGGGRGHVGHALADARQGHRHGLRPGRVREPRQRARRSTSAARTAARPSSRNRSTSERTDAMAAAEDYPEGLKYHAEHDWARIEGDEATLGVTWFAQDALGELVHFEAPADGGSTTKDASYGEVESVKAVSDVIAPLSGEILEVNQKVVDAPETVNEDPYGEGWLVRIRLSDPAEVDSLLDVDAYKQHLAEQ